MRWNEVVSTQLQWHSMQLLFGGVRSASVRYDSWWESCGGVVQLPVYTRHFIYWYPYHCYIYGFVFWGSCRHDPVLCFCLSCFHTAPLYFSTPPLYFLYSTPAFPLLHPCISSPPPLFFLLHPCVSFAATLCLFRCIAVQHWICWFVN